MLGLSWTLETVEESGKIFKRFRIGHHRVPSADQPSTLKGFLVSSKASILEVVSLFPFFAWLFWVH